MLARVTKLLGKFLPNLDRQQLTVTFAEEIGITLRGAREVKQDPIKALLAFLKQKQRDARVLFHGKIADAQEQSKGGFDGGIVTLTTLKKSRKTLSILNQNENLIVWDADCPQPLAMAPDIICLLTPDGVPLTNADALDTKKGEEVFLIAMKAADRLYQSPILENFMASLQSLGYYGPYIPFNRTFKTE